MSVSPSVEVAEFCLEGRFLEFVIKDGYKLKGLLLATAEGQCYVKLAKHLRVAFDLHLPKGTWLQVVGTKKYDSKKGQETLKAERVMAACSEIGRFPPQISHTMKQLPETSEKNHTKEKSTQTKATILVCQKSDCMKRGGKALCQALERELENNGLDNVIIKGTGCMKNCKAGPNLVMPDKTRYSRIQATQVPTLIDKHIGGESREEARDADVNIPSYAEVY
ncbi:(2Fe-2S) ferredoxin domain-containing protein [Anabaena cylindrica UHCC 0172]|uniref:(2Fe-2S) ferredoxin domain-containing protein n=1 Tax=Anabaena cylindrica TaxID=1165 RepID=UPI002B1F489E|nr:(2Fe-2S) ferredoxin domain-containing protein [Anabaena cylindrica]MEA5551945.1 (2Fe-2S) ferredoxin domain-containing protein [Anabaena cylindrica UHCC 0172]